MIKILAKSNSQNLTRSGFRHLFKFKNSIKT